MTRRCETCGAVLGPYASKSIKVCRKCRNKQRPTKKRVSKDDKTIPCKTDGCPEKVTKLSRTGICRKCQRKALKVPCATEGCNNLTEPNTREWKVTDLCKICYDKQKEAKRRARDKSGSVIRRAVWE